MAREKGMGSLQREKSGRWTMRVCVNGMRFSRSTRTRDRAQAEQFLMRFLAPLGLGERTIPLAYVWREYEKSPNRRELSPATMRWKQQIWMSFARWLEENHLEISQLKQLSPSVIAEYLRVLRLAHSATAYNNRLCTLREICRTLADQAGVFDDPWRGIRLLADDCHTRREFTALELSRIMSAAKQCGENWHLLFAVGVYTGLRLGDCCTLEWNSINLERGIIQLIPRKTRRHSHGRPVTIPIHPDLAAMLQARQTALSQTSDSTAAIFVIPEFAEWYHGHYNWRINNGLSKIFISAGIKTSVKIEGRRSVTPDATFHSLRHTFVSFSANAGVPLAVVQSIVGHSSSAMTRHYYHENEDALRKAVASIPSLSDLSGDGTKKVFPPVSTPNCIASRLTQLEALNKAGLLSEEEYSRERLRILSEI